MKNSNILPIIALPICLAVIIQCSQPVPNVVRSQSATSAAQTSASAKKAATPKVVTPVVAAADDSEETSDEQGTVSAGADANDEGQINVPQVSNSGIFTLTSEAFDDFESIPNDFVAINNGGNISPPLSWRNAPAGTGSFAIQMVDLDFQNPPFIHWAISEIPSTTTDLPKGIDGGDDLTSPREAEGAEQAVDYRGPNPPSLHRYEITIFAIRANALLNLGQNSADNLVQLNAASLGKAVLTGTSEP